MGFLVWLPIALICIGRIIWVREEHENDKYVLQLERIIEIAREYEAGAKLTELCRRHGISSATFYKWRTKYGGMEVSDARKLKALEEENRKLKKLLAESMLDVATLREALGKNF